MMDPYAPFDELRSMAEFSPGSTGHVDFDGQLLRATSVLVEVDAEALPVLIGSSATQCFNGPVLDLLSEIAKWDRGFPYSIALRLRERVHLLLAPTLCVGTGPDAQRLRYRYRLWQLRFGLLKIQAQLDNQMRDQNETIRCEAPILLAEISDIAQSLGGRQFKPNVAEARRCYERLRLPIPEWIRRFENPTPKISFSIEDFDFSLSGPTHKPVS